MVRRKRPFREAASRVPTAAVVAAIGLLVIGVVLALFNENQVQAQKLREDVVQADILAGSVTAALSFDAPRQAREYVDALATNPEVEVAAVYDSSGTLVASYARKGAAAPATNAIRSPSLLGNDAIVSRPVVERGQVFGSVYLRTIQEPLTRRLARYSGIALLVVMAALVVIVLGAGNAALSEAHGKLKAEMAERERTEAALQISLEQEANAQIELAAQRGREALRQSEQQLEFALAAGRLGSWEINLENGQLLASEIFRRTCCGQASDTRLDTVQSLESCILPEDRPALERAFAQAVTDKADLEVEFRTLDPAGEERWMLLRGRAVYDPDGKASRIAGVSLDITDRKAFEERQRLMVDELNHRVKNTLATVQSIALQLGRMSPDVATFQSALLQRIIALARIHDLLSRVSWRGAQLEEILQQTVAPHVPEDGLGKRVSLDGPPVHLGPNAAVTLTMAFHELTTNAAKYGALSTASGRVEVTWRSDDPVEPRLIDILWREIGGPVVGEPQRRGFGTRFIERGVAHEFDGSAELEFAATGLACRLRIPLSLQLRLAA